MCPLFLLTRYSRPPGCVWCDAPAACAPRHTVNDAALAGCGRATWLGAPSFACRMQPSRQPSLQWRDARAITDAEQSATQRLGVTPPPRTWPLAVLLLLGRLVRDARAAGSRLRATLPSRVPSSPLPALSAADQYRALLPAGGGMDNTALTSRQPAPMLCRLPGADPRATTAVKSCCCDGPTCRQAAGPACHRLCLPTECSPAIPPLETLEIV